MTESMQPIQWQFGVFQNACALAMSEHVDPQVRIEAGEVIQSQFRLYHYVASGLEKTLSNPVFEDDERLNKIKVH